jgi:putative hydrolase of the HAD superfamily
VFIDDMPHNVEGARAVGIAGIQFENAVQCEEELKALGLSF